MPAVALCLSLSSAALVLGSCAKNQAANGSATLSITSPAEHIHIHIDGSSDYQVLTRTTGQIELSPGQHTIEVLAQPNHSQTATTASVSVTVTGGSAGSPSPSSGGRYGYGSGS